ncbi:transporter [Stutzerimonas xanthomarina]|uniref:AEC family transporter n=1 Tax=Stutzerimonas nitrititolerans TaxID=2482751 RepID=UPI0008267703|nr:AEC family transporter [Stutzerimonas nitrititolerans]OCX12166.1 transporter [Stutzerimonas xanthomarina]HBB80163.1 AEC family transporter [Pseudomonas sp.]
MSSVVNVVLPVFALIFLGYMCRRTNRLGPSAASELNRFVVWLGLPALLFKITATSTWAEVWQPGFIAAFSIGCLGVFAFTLLYRVMQKQPLVDASLDALGASYANTGYVGFPLCLLILGEAGLQPALVASLIVVCVLFALALACVEMGLHAGQGIAKTLAKVSRSLSMNPLVLAPLLGGAWAFGGLELPSGPKTLLELLGAAAAPCALVSLGLFLAQPQPSGPVRGVWPLVLLKLIVQPALTWYFAAVVFELEPLWVYSALLLSALPTGTGPYMLAEFYGREGWRVSRVVLLSTLGSLVTLSICLYLLPV